MKTDHYNMYYTLSHLKDAVKRNFISSIILLIFLLVLVALSIFLFINIALILLSFLVVFGFATGSVI